MKRKVLAVVGARPQFVKAGALVRAYREGRFSRFFSLKWVHTGQHYDYQMSDVFYSGLKLPAADYHLNVGSLPPAEQIARMMQKLEPLMKSEAPDLVLVFGDTNSTLAGALTAKVNRIPVAHVEAGLRSFDSRMPEETNRILTDRISELLFCPTKTAVSLLKAEGLVQGVSWSGDVMADLLYREVQSMKLVRKPSSFYLATIHRNTNTDCPMRLESIFEALRDLNAPVKLPLHPRTLAFVKKNPRLYSRIHRSSELAILPPVSYHDLLSLLYASKGVITDSGGLQKEAYLANVPCVTLRDNTEWTETVAAGRNVLCHPDAMKIRKAFARMEKRFRSKPEPLFGQGKAAHKVLSGIKTWMVRLESKGL